MIEYRNVRKEYRGRVETVVAVDDLSMRVEPGELCVLLGPSGCGKTTLLRMTNRLIEPTSGEIIIDGRDARAEDPVMLRRRIGYVIQGVGLFPHRTVAENVATTAELIGMPAREVRERVDSMLALVNLDPAVYRNRYPAQLSGGESQRVGVARALAADPPLLLMDEPFGAIDPINRGAIQREFRELHRRLGKTVIFVSHDIPEALFLADRIGLMLDGRLVRCASPAEILTDRSDGFAASFFGEDRMLMILDILHASDALEPAHVQGAAKESLSSGATLRHAMALLLASSHERMSVVDASGAEIGTISLESIRRAVSHAAHAQGGESPAPQEESLK